MVDGFKKLVLAGLNERVIPIEEVRKAVNEMKAGKYKVRSI